MQINRTGKKYNIWWGPPKKFSTIQEDRKISWLELFYDLVYVIVISRTTHFLAVHPGWEGFIEYWLLFMMIFWGWINGSWYYELHGSLGIRTRLMMLWQMMAVAALCVTLNDPSEIFVVKITVTLMFLQAYITYLWWSVGIYDKEHRRLNVPYTLCYLAALILIGLTLFVPPPYKKAVFAVSLFFNFLPPFLVNFLWGRRRTHFRLSLRMVERLGSFTIIVFGEVILGIISGTSAVTIMDTRLWFCFGLGILVVFAIWWIFFSLIADRDIKDGFLKSQFMSMLYIPALGSLGIVGATFSGLIDGMDGNSLNEYFFHVKILFGAGLSFFLISICVISRFLIYPGEYEGAHRILLPLIIVAAIVILATTVLFHHLSLAGYLVIIFFVLTVIVVMITRIWFKAELRRTEKEEKEN